MQHALDDGADLTDLAKTDPAARMALVADDDSARLDASVPDGPDPEDSNRIPAAGARNGHRR